MNTIHAEVSLDIAARPEAIYAVLADYDEGHPAIVPKPFFQELSVLEGGQGAGTLIRVRLKVMGIERRLEMRIAEPEPGRVLTETDEEAGVVTTFTVEPTEDGRAACVTITSDARPSAGFMGFLEKLTGPPITRKIFREELALLADYVLKKEAAKPGGVRKPSQQ